MPERLWLRKTGRIAVNSLAAIGLLAVVVTATPLVKWWARGMSGAWPDPKGEVLIVLGGDLIDGNTLGQTSFWRSLYAARTYRSGNFREVVVSGQDVAPLMRDYLVCHGVPAEAIRVEGASKSTRENAVNTARMLANAQGRKVLVSGDMHILRARRAFARAGLDVVPCPFPYGIKRAGSMLERWSVFLDLASETAKLGYYLTRGWI